MKGYKAFDKDWKCRDFQYKIGETYELPEGQELKICQCGFHFCKNPIDVFGYYPFKDETMIAEVEALGEIRQEGTKYVTNKIKIVREFTRDELQLLILDGNYNSGDCNSGNYNSGNYNSGNCNSGIFNTDTPFMMSFNRPTSMTYVEFLNSLSYSFYGLCLRISRNEIDADDIERIKALPNFDAEIFKEITGIHIG